MTVTCTLDRDRTPPAAARIDCWTPGAITDALDRGHMVPADWPFRLLDGRYKLPCCGCGTSVGKDDAHDVNDGATISIRCGGCCPVCGAGVDVQGGLFDAEPVAASTREGTR